MSVEKPPVRAVIVSVQTQGMSDLAFDSSMIELTRLAKTLGIEVIARVTQKRERLDATVLGAGKLMELARLTGGTGVVPRGPEAQKKKVRGAAQEAMAGYTELHGQATEHADLVIVDAELSPTQTRDLGIAAGVEVTDRTGIIVDIFHRHASTQESKIQVELARLKYQAPRLRASGGAGERQAGKGAGESNLELDRRKVRDRIAALTQELKSVQTESQVRSARRNDALRVALVGYTNAGKSSWMRALTTSSVLVENKLFATLDTTVRALYPAITPQVLVSDTVGFIQRLPHDLVASFRSTLEEAKDASLLLHVVDASDLAFEAHRNVTLEVLEQINALEGQNILVLNKIDRCDAARRKLLSESYPDALQVSSKDPSDVARLHSIIVDAMENLLDDLTLIVPYDRSALIGEVHKRARVINEDFQDDGVHYELKLSKTESTRLQRLVFSQQ